MHSRRTLICGALLFVAVGGCVEHRIVASTHSIHRQVPALRSKGVARVELSNGKTREFRTTERFYVVVRDPISGTLYPKELSLGELIENCPDTPPFAGDTFRRDPPCRLLDVQGKALDIGREQTVDRDRAVLGFGALAVAGALGACMAACDKPLNTISIVPGLLAFIVAGFALFGH